jgi:hypothetical protein
MAEAEVRGRDATRGRCWFSSDEKNSSSIYKKLPSENLWSVRLSFLPVYLFLTWTVLCATGRTLNSLFWVHLPSVGLQFLRPMVLCAAA